MDEEPEFIRQQMDEAKTQLSEKLETLEHQIAETVKSTGTAVNATVEAVQETAEAVTVVVQDVAQTVCNSFDFRRQIDRHPCLFVGGAVALGYLAFEFLTAPTKTVELPSEANQSRPPFVDSGQFEGQQVADSTATKADIAAAYESTGGNSSWYQLRDVAIGVMISVVQDFVSRSGPSVVDYLVGNMTRYRDNGSENFRETEASERPQWAPQGEQRLRVATTGNVRSRNSF